MTLINMQFYANTLQQTATILMPRVTATFKLSTNLADCFIAGISMGGYGALRWGLIEPKQFRGIGVISGAGFKVNCDWTSTNFCNGEYRSRLVILGSSVTKSITQIFK